MSCTAWQEGCGMAGGLWHASAHLFGLLLPLLLQLSSQCSIDQQVSSRQALGLRRCLVCSQTLRQALPQLLQPGLYLLPLLLVLLLHLARLLLLVLRCCRQLFGAVWLVRQLRPGAQHTWFRRSCCCCLARCCSSCAAAAGPKRR